MLSIFIPPILGSFSRPFIDNSTSVDYKTTVFFKLRQWIWLFMGFDEDRAGAGRQYIPRGCREGLCTRGKNIAALLYLHFGSPRKRLFLNLMCGILSFEPPGGRRGPSGPKGPEMMQCRKSFGFSLNRLKAGGGSQHLRCW